MPIPINQKKARVRQLFEEINQSDTDKFSLAHEALDMIDDILKDNPFCLDARVDKMWLYTEWVFDQIDEVINQAQFIIDHQEFGKDRMLGYDWLFWVYNNKFGIPEKAQEIIEEQLIELQSFDKKYEKDKIEGELLNKLANLKFDKDQYDKALGLWYKSYLKNPYIVERNAKAGILFLEHEDWKKAEELLLMHYEWSFEYEDGYRLQYGIKLKELFKADKLKQRPNLVGLLFNIIRNEKVYFKLEGKLDFFKTYLPEVEKWAKNNPESSLLWNAIANTYYFDVKNYTKSFQAFSVLLQTPQNFRFNDIERLYYSAKNTKEDFFALPFNFQNNTSRTCYSLLTGLLEISRKISKKKKRKKVLKLAIQAGAEGYLKYKEFLFNDQGSTENNQPHLFAMLCNNYANAIASYAFLKYKNDEEKKIEYFAKAGAIHLEGYAISPFRENLENASSDFFTANENEKSIQCSKELLKNYAENLSVFDFQNEYWQITYCYIRLKDFENAVKYYHIAKDFYLKYGRENKEAEFKFIFTAKLLYQYVVRDLKDYTSFIPEMEWYLENKIAFDQEPKEHGLVNHYLGLCYQNNGANQKAIKAFKEAVKLMENCEEVFYETKAEESRHQLKKLGVSLKKEKPSLVIRVKKILFFPLGLFVLIGLLIMSKLSTNKSKIYSHEKK